MVTGLGRYRPEIGYDDDPPEPHVHERVHPSENEAGTDRIINLIQPAIDVLKSQAELTRLGKQYQVEVKLREYGRTDVHPCTFVFNPQIASGNGRAGHHYAVGSINQSWEAAMRRANGLPGVRILDG